MTGVSSTNSDLAPKTIKWAGIGAAVGATVQGVSEYAAQKNILNHPDEYITRLKGETASQMSFCTPFFKGTGEAADLAKQTLEQQLKDAEKFVKNGKIDFKAVAKRAGIGAVVAACAWVNLYVIYTAFKKLGQSSLRENAKIVAEEFKNN